MSEKCSDTVLGIARCIEARMLSVGYPKAMLSQIVVELPSQIWDECLENYAAEPICLIRGVSFRRKET